jgi:adenylate cyclase
VTSLNEEQSQGKHHRKLAAIMFTDMVGFSSLSQSNETLALELLEEHRRILRPLFPKHSGREIETAGDSFFVEFHSAVDAANCAIEIQTLLYERNKSVDSAKQIKLRIGLHIGDVVEMENHVHGDGVNIAARLEPLATPEGICLSEDFARAVQNKLSYPVHKKGEARLKNITSPMEIYCIKLPWVKEKTLKAQYDKKSFNKILMYAVPLSILIIAAIITFSPFFNDDKELHTRLAVLPFLNIGGDPEDEYFAEGMTEQIISSLSNLSGLNVIARSSVLKYKDMPKDIRDIGDELNVGTVLEGSIRKYMNKARITVKLIDVSTQQNLWAMDYDRELQDIFLVQSEIAQSIVDELEVKLNREEKERLDKKVIVNTDAYNYYLLGRFHLNRRTIEGVTRSISYFEAAINYDNTFALAYSGLADAYTLIGVGYGNIPQEEAVLKAKENVMRALELDENLAEAHASLAYIKFRLEWEFDEAEKEFKKAIELGPSYAQAHEWYALYLSLRGRFKEALERMRKAQELNPLSASINNGIGRIYYFMNDTKNAVAQFNKTLEMDPNYAETYASLGMTYDLMKDYKKSILNLEKAVNLSNRRLVILSRLAYSYALAGRKDEVMKIKQEIDERSKTEDVSEYYYISIYAGLGDYDKVFEYMEKAYQKKFGLLLYLKADKGFAELTRDPRYAEFVKKIGL